MTCSAATTRISACSPAAPGTHRRGPRAGSGSVEFDVVDRPGDTGSHRRHPGGPGCAAAPDRPRWAPSSQGRRRRRCAGRRSDGRDRERDRRGADREDVLHGVPRWIRRPCHLEPQLDAAAQRAQPRHHGGRRRRHRRRGEQPRRDALRDRTCSGTPSPPVPPVQRLQVVSCRCRRSGCSTPGAGRGSAVAALPAANASTCRSPGAPGCRRRGRRRSCSISPPSAPTRRGNLRLQPAGRTRVGTSNVNYEPGANVANLVICEIGTNGRLTLEASSPCDVVGDVFGYIAEGGDQLVAMAPRRLLDTRRGIGALATPTGPEHRVDLAVAGVGGVPAAATAVVPQRDGGERGREISRPGVARRRRCPDHVEPQPGRRRESCQPRRVPGR